MHCYGNNYGGKVFILGGDFRLILPNVSRSWHASVVISTMTYIPFALERIKLPVELAIPMVKIKIFI